MGRIAALWWKDGKGRELSKSGSREGVQRKLQPSLESAGHCDQSQVGEGKSKFGANLIPQPIWSELS